MKKFILIFGLPGAGKTTLCKMLAEKSDIHYINLDSHPDWGKVAIPFIIANEIRKVRNKHVITEGVFNPQFRTRILDGIPGIYKPIVVGLDEPPEILCMRRNRSLAAYQKMWKETDWNCDYLLKLSSLDERAKFIEKLIYG